MLAIFEFFIALKSHEKNKTSNVFVLLSDLNNNLT